MKIYLSKYVGNCVKPFSTEFQQSYPNIMGIYFPVQILEYPRPIDASFYFWCLGSKFEPNELGFIFCDEETGNWIPEPSKTCKTDYPSTSIIENSVDVVIERTDTNSKTHTSSNCIAFLIFFLPIFLILLIVPFFRRKKDRSLIVPRSSYLYEHYDS